MRAPEFWQRDGIAAKALSPLGALYGLTTRVKRQRARPFRSRARVLCVGNLTVGGTGKTPLAIAFAQLLKARGAHVAFLTRGYGGKFAGPLSVDPARHSAREVGDEALLLAAVAPTIVARDRAAGAEFASIETDVIVMDDGFQNFSLMKDLSILAIDAEAGFGNGHILPAGPLREPIAEGLQRADAVVLVGPKSPGAFPKLPDFSGPVLRARFLPIGESFKGRKVFAFAGIGRPEKFSDTLIAAGALVEGWEPFADHHVFSAAELETLRLSAQRRQASLVTTEKDYFRLDPKTREGIEAFKVQLCFEDPLKAAALLDRLIVPAANPSQ